MNRLHDIQYHVVLYEADANGGPGNPKFELTPDVLNLVWQQALNGASQAAFSMTRFNEKLASFLWMVDHVKVFRETDAGLRTVFAGKVIKPDETTRDTIVYCWDYMSFLQRSRTGFKTMYPSKTIKEIVDAEWALAKTVDTSPFAFVATGTTEAPLGSDDTTPITVNSTFGVVDFDRLYTFYALCEMSMANTDHTVVFEITREAPHTFNLWKNRSSPKEQFALVYPGNLIDYELDTGHDQLQNDIATVIIDQLTAEEVEYVVTSAASIASGVRRLQSAVTIKTLYGQNTGTTESDQQKGAVARILSQSVVAPKLLIAFPRQGVVEPFVGWDLGDTFRVTTRKHDKSGDSIDDWMACVGMGGSWTPESGELLQLYMR